MLTLFTVPKAFQGPIAVIQRNAICSWKLLHPLGEIILFGNEKGIAEIAEELGVRHIPDVACNEYGTPLINDVFQKAQDFAKYDILCYVNADIILMSDFIEAIKRIQKPLFLMIGQRWDLEVDRLVDFNSSQWEPQLREDLLRCGKPHPRWGTDYFVFKRGVFKGIPALSIGRTIWDNWLIYQARSSDIPVIDATEVVSAVHQSHGYSHHVKGERGVRQGAEARKNRELAGNMPRPFTLDDATWALTPKSLEPAVALKFPQQRMKIFYICENDLSRQAGDTIHVIEICKNLQKLGHEVTLYAPRWGQHKERISFEIKYIFSFTRGAKRFLIYQILLFFNLFRDVLIKKPDVICSRASWSPVALIISKLFRKPYIIEKIAVDMSKYKGNPISVIENFVLRRLGNLNIKFADMIVITTEENAKRLNKYYGVDKSKVEVVPSGVNTDLFKDIDSKKARELLGLEQDVYYIGFIGSIFNYSGIDNMIECLPFVLELIPNLKLILAGIDETQGLIRGLISRLRLEKDVLCIGEVPHSRIPLYMSALDIGLQLEHHTPHFWRSDPTKLYEYFAAGKAGVVSNIYRGFIEKINAGIAVDIDNKEEVRDAIVNLIKDEKRRIELGENGRRFVLENRTWRTSSVKIAKICEKVIKAR